MGDTGVSSVLVGFLVKRCAVRSGVALVFLPPFVIGRFLFSAPALVRLFSTLSLMSL